LSIQALSASSKTLVCIEIQKQGSAAGTSVAACALQNPAVLMLLQAANSAFVIQFAL
jgi:hypothetical protein